MKKIVFILLIALISQFTALAQKNSFAYQNQSWDKASGKWTPSGRVERIYNEDNDLIELLYQTWVDSEWVYTSQATYKYSKLSQLIERNVKIRKGDEWENLFVFLHEYNDKDLLSKQTVLLWSEEKSEYDLYYQHVLNYTNFDSLLEIKTFHRIDNEWILQDFANYQYNDINRVETITRMTNVGGDLKRAERDSLTYYNNGLEKEIYNQVWLDEWVDKEKYSYVWSGDSLLLEQNRTRMFEGEWLDYIKGVNTYNGKKLLHQKIISYYDSEIDEWIKNYLWTHTYNELDTLRERLIQWNEEDVWVNESRDILEETSGWSSFIAVDNNFMLFPNPFSNRICFDSHFIASRSFDVEVYNALGAAVYSKKAVGKNGKNCIEFNGFLPPGVYLLRLSADRKVFQQKILKQ